MGGGGARATGTARRTAPRSVALEVGHRWTGRRRRPWLRAGYLWSSGDADPGDGRHGTFFPMLPSSRKYALSSIYAQMNLPTRLCRRWFEPRRVKSRIENT